MAETEGTSGVPHKAKGFSFWGKVGLIAGAGLCLVAFGGVMYLNSTGILPAANRLNNARAAYESSGAPKSAAELEALFKVPDDKNASRIFAYLTNAEGMDQNLQFPRTGKKGEKYTISWSKFIADVDRAKAMPHFRPKRDFTKPYSIIYPEFAILQGAISELFSQAAEAIESGNLAQAEICVKRIATLDGWFVDQPIRFGILLRLLGAQDDLKFVGNLVNAPAGKPEVVQILRKLISVAERKLDLASVAKAEAFSFTCLENLREELFSDLTSPGAGSSSTAPTSVSEIESRAFEYVLKSSLGRKALATKGFEVAADFYQEWARTTDLGKAYDACDHSISTSDQTPLSKFLGGVLPLFTSSRLSILEFSITAHLYRTALWLYECKGDPNFNLAKISAQDLPKELQVDPMNNPIRVKRRGNELMIYSFGVNGIDDGGSSKDTVFSVQLKP